MTTSTRQIQWDATREAEVGGDERHEWSGVLPAGRFASVRVEQRGIDLIVELFEGDAHEPSRIVDGLNGEWGTERVVLVAEDDEREIRLVVYPHSPTSPRAGYRLVTSELRPVDERARRLVAGERLFDEAERLRRRGGAESLARAVPLVERATDHFDAARDEEWRLVARGRRGWLLEHLGRGRDARSAYDDVLGLAGELGRRDEEVILLNRLGRLSLAAGDLEEAEEHFDQAMDVAREIEESHPALRATCHNNRGLLLYRREDLSGALEQFQLARERWSSLENRPRDLALTLHNMGHVLRAQGKLQEAIDVLAEARTLREQSGDRLQAVRTLLQLGDLYRRAGRPEEARDLFADALDDKAEALPDEVRVRVGNNFGLILAELGDTEAAEPYLRQALELAVTLEDRRGEAMAALNLAHLQRLRGTASEARALVRRAREIFRTFDDRRHLAACDLVEGQTLRDEGRLEEAVGRMESAVEKVETLRLGQRGWDFRMAFFATRQTYFEELLELRVQLYETSGETRHLEKALQVSERGRARSLLDALVENELAFRGPAHLLQEERRLLEEVAEIERQLASEPLLDESDLERSRRDLLLRLESVRAEIHSSSPQYADLTRPRPLSVSEIRRQVLDGPTMLLVYSLGERRSFLWVLEVDSPLEHHVLPGRGRIEDAVEAVRDALASRSLDRAERHRRQIGEFSDLVLGPLAGRLTQPRRLAVVADGALHLVPFGGLVHPDGEEGDTRPWLIERHEVVHLPSASSLAALRREQGRRRPAARHLAVFADPVFSAADERLEGRPDGEPPEALREALRSFGAGTELERLPGTREEAEAVTSRIPSSETLLALSFAASRETFESEPLEEYQVLHFATHGFLHPQHPELSGFVLSLFDEEGKRVDGFIRAHELYSRRLGAELAILSACQTGMGREVRGEGLVGLPRGFLYAGVPRVIVSLWNVEDQSTAELMGHLYHWLDEGKAPAAALRRAQLALLDSDRPERRLPAHWAAFAFLGDWLPIGELGGGMGGDDSGGGQLDDPGKGTSYEFHIGEDGLEDEADDEGDR